MLPPAPSERSALVSVPQKGGNKQAHGRNTTSESTKPINFVTIIIGHITPERHVRGCIVVLVVVGVVQDNLKGVEVNRIKNIEVIIVLITLQH